MVDLNLILELRLFFVLAVVFIGQNEATVTSCYVGSSSTSAAVTACSTVSTDSMFYCFKVEAVSSTVSLDAVTKGCAAEVGVSFKCS